MTARTKIYLAIIASGVLSVIIVILSICILIFGSKDNIKMPINQVVASTDTYTVTLVELESKRTILGKPRLTLKYKIKGDDFKTRYVKTGSLTIDGRSYTGDDTSDSSTSISSTSHSSNTYRDVAYDKAKKTYQDKHFKHTIEADISILEQRSEQRHPNSKTKFEKEEIGTASFNISF